MSSNLRYMPNRSDLDIDGSPHAYVLNEPIREYDQHQNAIQYIRSVIGNPELSHISDDELKRSLDTGLFDLEEIMDIVGQQSHHHPKWKGKIAGQDQSGNLGGLPPSRRSWHRDAQLAPLVSRLPDPQPPNRRFLAELRPSQAAFVWNDFEDQPHVLEKGQTTHSPFTPVETIEGAENKRVCGAMATILSNKSAYKAFLNSNGEKAQMALDIVQKLLDNQETSKELRRSTLYAMVRLCTKSGVYPRCLVLHDVRYEAKPIASGSFGEIWRGYYQDYPVCLKVARVYQGSEVEHIIRSYTKEAIVWSQLKHPNLLPFYGIYKLDEPLGRVCLVSPWMQNGNLYEYLKENPQVPRLPLVQEFLAGLGHLHEHSIVHGDLKGANILISPAGSACLADFGLSSVVDTDILRWTSLQTITRAGGTVRWEAPEIMDELEDGSAPRPTLQSDVYSAASVMYEVFTGQIPFYEFPRDATVISRVIKGLRPSRPLMGQDLELSDNIWEVMQECWSHLPGERPTAHEVAEKLCEIPPTESTMRRIARDKRRKREETWETETLTPMSFRSAVRSQTPSFSRAEFDLLREYLN